MYDETPPLTDEDRQHLSYLAYGHFVIGGLTLICGAFPFIHLAVGIGIVSGRMGGRADPAGFIFIVVAVFLITMFWSFAGLVIYAGKCMRAQRRRTLCFVVAVCACVFLNPFGLVLGIFSIIVLMRPSVKAAFEANDRGAAASAVAPISF